MEITGILQEAKDSPSSGKNGMYFLTVDGEDYSGWGKLPAGLEGNEGSTIKLEYTTKGEYKNIKGFELTVGTQQKLPDSVPKKGNSDPGIRRLALLKAACTLLQGRKVEKINELAWELTDEWEKMGHRQGLW